MIKRSYQPSLAVALLGCILISTGNAHSPHDVIYGLVASPNYAEDGMVFAIVDHAIKRSVDRGLSWKASVSGLDNRDSFRALAITSSFSRDRTIFATAGTDGVYRSSNAGESWERSSDGLEGISANRIAVSPNFESSRVVLVIADDGTVFRSSNGGVSWVPSRTMREEFTAVAFGGFDQSSLAVVGDTLGDVWMSRDEGQSWDALPTPTESIGVVSALMISPTGLSQGGAILIGTSAGSVYEFDGTNQAITRIGSFSAGSESAWGNDRAAVTSLAVSSDYPDSGMIYAATWNEAVMKTGDGGTTWQMQSDGLSTAGQANTPAYFSPQFKTLVTAQRRDGVDDVFLAGFDGLFKSMDGGEDWIQLETRPLAQIKHLAVSEDLNSKTAVAISTYGGGAYVSSDGGDSWVIATEGLRTTRLDGIVFSPEFARDRTLFAAASGALCKSTNGGQLWNFYEPGTNWRLWLSRRLRSWGLTTVARQILLPEERGQRPYPTDIQLSPAFERDRTVFFATRRHGVWVSHEAGDNSFKILDTEGVEIRSLAISPAFATDGTIFTVLKSGAVFRSVDGGLTWAGISSVGGHTQLAGDLYLKMSPDYQHDQTVFAYGLFGLQKSVDGGQNWNDVVFPGVVTPSVTGFGVSMNYADDGTVLAAVKGGALYLSTDSGNRFEPLDRSVEASTHELTHIEFSPDYQDDRIVYLASEETLFRLDTDRATWQELRRPVRYENTRDVLRYSGNWDRVWGSVAYREHVSRDEGSSVSLIFDGSGFIWRGTHGPTGGRATVEIDGELVGRISQRASYEQFLQPTFAVHDLAPGAHSVTISVVGGDDSRNVSIDAFDIFDEMNFEAPQ